MILNSLKLLWWGDEFEDKNTKVHVSLHHHGAASWLAIDDVDYLVGDLFDEDNTTFVVGGINAVNEFLNRPGTC